MEENEIKDVKKKKGVKIYHIIIIFFVVIMALLGIHIYANNAGYGDIIGLVKGEKKAENSKKQEEETVSDYFILYKGYEIKKVAGVQDLSEMKITDEATKKYNIVYYNYQSRQYTGEKEGSFGEEIYEGVSKVQNVDKIAISEKYNAIPRDFTATDKLPDELKDMADYTHGELNSIDLDGDGTEEKIICYHLNYKSGEIGDGSPKASSGLILMDSNYKKIADLETLENGFWGGIKEEAQKKFIDISDVEYIDIDIDGKMEMIIDIPTYEGTKISIIKYDEGKIEGQTDIKASVDNGKVNSATTNNTEKDVIQGENLSQDQENYGIESSKYIGTWQDDEKGTNTLVIKSVNNNKITFELGIFRTVVYENLIATIDSNNKVTFNTNGTEQGEFWEGVYGNLEFEDNKITVKITKSECDYIQPGFEIVFSIKK